MSLSEAAEIINKEKSGVMRERDVDYHATDAISSTFLRNFADSPAKAHYEKNAADKETPSRRMGTALHCKTLEPGKFDENYVIHDVDRRTVIGKKAVVLAKEQGKILLKQSEGDDIFGMSESLLSHPEVTPLWSSAIGVEASVYWNRSGRLCKARPDIMGDDWIADVKTGDVAKFSPSLITNHRYYMQAAWYAQGVKAALGVNIKHFYWFVVNIKPPYESAVFKIDTQSWQAGYDEIDQYFPQILQCEKTGIWPRHVPGVGDGFISSYRFRHIYGEQGQ